MRSGAVYSGGGGAENGQMHPAIEMERQGDEMF
jgi:hypothetical protein